MKTVELHQRILEIGKRIADKTKVTREERKLLKLAYREFYKREIKRNCWTCYQEIYFEIVNINPKQLEHMENGKFEVKEGALIDTHRSQGGPTGHYTSANMTDDIALGILAHNPKHIQNFVKPPKGWKKLVADWAKKNKIKVSEDALSNAGEETTAPDTTDAEETPTDDTGDTDGDTDSNDGGEVDEVAILSFSDLKEEAKKYDRPEGGYPRSKEALVKFVKSQS